MLKKIIKSKILITFLVSLGMFVLILFFSYLDSTRYSIFPFYSLNKSIQNNFYKVKNRTISGKSNKDIIVVEIDEKTLAKL